MGETEILEWLDENTSYGFGDKGPTPKNLLFFARERGGANVKDDNENWHRLTYENGVYHLARA